tara:strand:+ start:1243 stop:2172 length:930 start_codon:yes stop_codon:yes gene_type:complete
MNKNIKIFIAGHMGMVGSSCWKLFKSKGYKNLIGISSKNLDLRNQNDVKVFFEKEKPEIVIDAAAKVGGILANTSFPYEFLMENMLIQNNLIQASYENKVEKFIFLGSSCIYPKLSKQPIREEYLLSDELEETNQWYAIAKISGVKLCESIFNNKRQFISLMPTNLYGPNDNFNLKTSHVIPAMIRKFYEASKNNLNVELWGDGSPLREFMHVDDLSNAILFVIENNISESVYNVGSGQEYSIKQIAKVIASISNFKGEIIWNKRYPNGTPRKLLDSRKLNKMGWEAKINFETGVAKLYEWYKKQQSRC